MLKSYFLLVLISSVWINSDVSKAYVSLESTEECIHWGYLPKHHVEYGDEHLIYALEECYDACVNDKKCFAFDWDFEDPGCFLFTKDYEAPLNLNQEVNHYFFIRNQSNCQDPSRNNSWIPESNMQWNGKKNTKNATYLIDCITMCLGDDECSGVDWSSSNTECLLNIGRGELVNATNSTHFSRPFFVSPPEKSPTQLSSGLALKAEYIVLIAVGLGLILLTIIAIVVLCNYSKNKSKNLKSEDYFYDSSEVGTDLSDTSTDQKDKEKADINNATFRSIDYQMSKDAVIVETIHENDRIY